MSFRDDRITRLILAGAMGLWASGAAAQADLRVEVDATALLSENPFLLSGDDTAAAAVEIAVRPSVSWSLSPGTELEARGAIASRQYSRRYGNFVTGRADLEARRRRNEFLSYSAVASFARDISTEVLTSTIDTAVDPRSIRQSYGARSAVEWNLDSYHSVDATVGWEKAEYKGADLLADTQAFDVGATFSKRVSARTSVGVRATATFSDVGAASDLSTRALLATVERRLSENWRASGELGVERSSNRFGGRLGLDVRDEARTRLSGRGEFCYENSRLEACAAGSLQSEVSSFGGLQRRALLNGSVRRRLNARDVVEAVGSYSRATVLGGGLPSLDALRLGGSYERRLSRDLSLRGSLDYLRRQLLTGERVGAGFVQLRLTFRREPR